MSIFNRFYFLCVIINLYSINSIFTLNGFVQGSTTETVNQNSSEYSSSSATPTVCPNFDATLDENGTISKPYFINALPSLDCTCSGSSAAQNIECPHWSILDGNDAVKTELKKVEGAGFCGTRISFSGKARLGANTPALVSLSCQAPVTGEKRIVKFYVSNSNLKPRGSYCSTEKDCIPPLKCTEIFSSVNKKCLCPEDDDDSVFVAVKNTCMPRASLNESCHEDLQCKTMYSVCTLNTCTCEEGYWSSKFGNNCEWKGSISLNEYCTASKPCKDVSSECVSTVCQCKYGYIPDPSRNYCAKKADVALNGVCFDRKQCENPYADCIVGRCTCQSNFKPSISGTNCELRTDIPLNGYCTSSYQCYAGNSVCKFNKCACDTGYRASFGACILISDVPLGGSCLLDSECYDVNSECNWKVCKCKYNYKPSISNSYCIEVRTVYLDGYCTSSDECKSLNSMCIGNLCKCKSGYKKTISSTCTWDSGSGFRPGIYVPVFLVILAIAVAVGLIRHKRRLQRLSASRQTIITTSPTQPSGLNYPQQQMGPYTSSPPVAYTISNGQYIPPAASNTVSTGEAAPPPQYATAINSAPPPMYFHLQQPNDNAKNASYT